jgi:hypothetical protein
LVSSHAGPERDHISSDLIDRALCLVATSRVAISWLLQDRLRYAAMT